MPGPTAIIFSGGDRPGPAAVHDLPEDRFVIAADSGLDHTTELGVPVDLVVGDLDSVDADVLAAAESAGVAIERHPVDKDRTDGELALTAAVERGATRAIVIGGFGGRIDHLLANVALWAAPAWAGLHLEVRSGEATLVVLHGPEAHTITGAVGELLSLLAVGGPATGVTTEGLRYALADDRLLPGSTRGVSNELSQPEARITIGQGTLLVVRPGAPPQGVR